MFELPQHTTINSDLKVTKTIDELKKYYISTDHATSLDSQLQLITDRIGDNLKVYALQAGPVTAIKPFIDPVVFDYEDKKIMVFDARTSTRYDKSTRRAVVNNRPLYRRDIIRSVFQSFWMEEGPKTILGLGLIQVRVFATWLAEAVTRRFGLDAEQQYKLTVYSGFYYLCLSSSKDKLDKDRATIILSRALTGLSLNYIKDALVSVEYLENISDYIKNISTVLTTERLTGVNEEILISALAGSWFGPNHTVWVGESVEYPPLFCTMLYLGLTDRGSRMTGLSKLALRFERDPKTKEFMDFGSNMIKNYVNEGVVYD